MTSRSKVILIWSSKIPLLVSFPQVYHVFMLFSCRWKWCKEYSFFEPQIIFTHFEWWKFPWNHFLYASNSIICLYMKTKRRIFFSFDLQMKFLCIWLTQIFIKSSLYTPYAMLCLHDALLWMKIAHRIFFLWLTNEMFMHLNRKKRDIPCWPYWI